MDLSAMKPIDRTKQIMNSLEILTDIAQYPEQRRITEEAIEQSYVNFGLHRSRSHADPDKEAPTLKDVIALLQEKLQEGTYEYPAELENAIYRLRQFAREGEDFFARKSTIDMGKLSKSGLVAVDLSALPDEKFRALAALFILQTLKEIMRSEGWSETKGLKTIVVLDEAWKVASDERSDAITIVREGRKYQFGAHSRIAEPDRRQRGDILKRRHHIHTQDKVREVHELSAELAQLLCVHKGRDRQVRGGAGGCGHGLPDLAEVPGDIRARQDIRRGAAVRLHDRHIGHAYPERAGHRCAYRRNTSWRGRSSGTSSWSTT